MLVTIPSGDAVSWFQIILLTISKLTPVDGIQVYVDIGYSKNKMISIHVMSFPDAPCMDFVPAFGECGGANVNIPYTWSIWDLIGLKEHRKIGNGVFVHINCGRFPVFFGCLKPIQCLRFPLSWILTAYPYLHV